MLKLLRNILQAPTPPAPPSPLFVFPLRDCPSGNQSLFHSNATVQSCVAHTPNTLLCVSRCSAATLADSWRLWPSDEGEGVNRSGRSHWAHWPECQKVKFYKLNLEFSQWKKSEDSLRTQGLSEATVYLLPGVSKHCSNESIFVPVPIPVLELTHIIWRFRVGFQNWLRFSAGSDSGSVRIWLTVPVLGSGFSLNSWSLCWFFDKYTKNITSRR